MLTRRHRHLLAVLLVLVALGVLGSSAVDLATGNVPLPNVTVWVG